MRTKTFQVYGLRGIDLRWRAQSNSAAIARDLTWDGSDAWKNAGGYIHIDGNPGQSKSDSNFSSDNETMSLHWFSQHNGAVQWLLWEREADTGLAGLFHLQSAVGYTSSFAKLTGVTTVAEIISQPEEPLIDAENTAWSGTSATRSRTVISSPRPPSQSETYGGRIYIVNGHDEPIVFNGKYTDRAGFASGPAAPIASVVYAENTDGTPHDETNRTPSMGLGSDKYVPGTTTDVDEVAAPACGYRYCVTFLNERGQESPMSSPSEVVSFSVDIEGVSSTFDSGHDPGDASRTRERRFITIKIPTGGTETVARRLYRTADIFDEEGNATIPSYAEDYYFLREIQDNDTTIIEDGVPDAFLGALVEPIDFGSCRHLKTPCLSPA